MTQASSPRSEPSDRFLWVSALSGPVIWSIYFLIGYLVVEAICKTSFLSTTILVPIIVALTVIAAAATVYMGLLSYRIWRASGEEGELHGEEFRNKYHSRFMTFIGLILNALFAITIVLTGIPVLYLPLCHY